MLRLHGAPGGPAGDVPAGHDVHGGAVPLDEGEKVRTEISNARYEVIPTSTE